MPSNTRPTYPRSDHFDGERFFNPGVDTDKSFADLLRWQRMRQRAAWPSHVENPPAQPLERINEADEIALTFIGHSTYLIRTRDLTIMTDPIFSERASPFTFAGPKRARAPGLRLAALPAIDAVLLSHNHYDHLDLASLKALRAHSSPTIVTGLGNRDLLAAHGIEPTIELDWWESAAPKADVRVTFVPAQHWSSRTMFDRRRALWGGHVMETAAGRIYFAGDTGAFDGFGAIRNRLGAPDVAILPIGAYAPRWFMQTQHMNPEEAVEAHLTLGASCSLAAHWGTFQLTDEGIDEPIAALDQALREHGVSPAAFLAPRPGETIVWRAGAGRVS